MDYIAYLHKERKSDYGVSFPDFPGIATAGKTLGEAQRFAAEALALHIRGMVEDGEVIPEPSTLDELAKDPDMKDAVAFLVTAKAPDVLVRVNITAKKSQLEKIDSLAEQAGLTRSAYIVQLATKSWDALLGVRKAEARGMATTRTTWNQLKNKTMTAAERKQARKQAKHDLAQARA